jgi:hypothetical protein
LTTSSPVIPVLAGAPPVASASADAKAVLSVPVVLVVAGGVSPSC